jgi:hypothetical protein|tara:strand:+ start:749 stop:955 length:207 start_codon:yes stop_codon:yes gene_type:complete
MTTFKLSDQALGAIMMALQKSLMEQTDIVPVLKSFELSPTDGAEEELLVTNPPTIKVDEPVASDWSET